jgi:hypothetical protein
VGIAEAFITSWSPEETKRDFWDRLFARLPTQPKAQEVLMRMARDLAQQDSFPDLLGFERSNTMLQEAKESIAALKREVGRLNDQVQTEEEKRKSQQRLREVQEEARKSRQDLDRLSKKLDELSRQLGSQQAGYDFQTWFFDLMDFFEIVNRPPYNTGGRQIDGSITVSGTTYLVELKFEKNQASSPDIDSLTKKVSDKADNTMGIMVAISGYSTTAIKEASGRRTTLLLLDFRHLYLALSGACSFEEIVGRVRRHASQTGESFLAPEDFGG